jgi:hypothetical protein
MSRDRTSRILQRLYMLQESSWWNHGMGLPHLLPRNQLNAVCVNAATAVAQSRIQEQNCAWQYAWDKGQPICVNRLVVFPAPGFAANGS